MDKTQPENLGFLRRFRALLDDMAAVATGGEVGDGSRSLQDGRRLYERRRQAAHVLYLRPARAGIHRGATSAAGREFPVNVRTAGSAGPSQSRRHAFMSAASRRARPTGSALAKLRSRCLPACGHHLPYQGRNSPAGSGACLRRIARPLRHPLLAGLRRSDGCDPDGWERELTNALSEGAPWLAGARRAPKAGGGMHRRRRRIGARALSPDPCVPSAPVRGGRRRHDLPGHQPRLLVLHQRKGSERLLFVFNLTQDRRRFTFRRPRRRAASHAVLHRFSADNAISLAALRLFCGRLRLVESRCGCVKRMAALDPHPISMNLPHRQARGRKSSNAGSRTAGRRVAGRAFQRGAQRKAA